jgi:hypothetical protein
MIPQKTGRSAHRWVVIPIAVFGFLCSCSSGLSMRPPDAGSPDDSIIVGRLRFLPGSSCTKLFQLPCFELRNMGDRKSTSFSPTAWTAPEQGRGIDIPISHKVSPGTYEFRIEVEKGTWDSVWLDEHLLTLVRFEVPRGLLVYFGTIEVHLTCEGTATKGIAHYDGHTVQNESTQELDLFRDEYPKVYEMYQNKVFLQVKQAPWQEL